MIIKCFIRIFKMSMSTVDQWMQSVYNGLSGKK